MQTFVPIDGFQEIVISLDWRRLGKQRVEGKQILDNLQGRSSGWINHPAVRMWRGNEDALAMYVNYCIREWIERGYNNTMSFYKIGFDLNRIELPNWWGGSIHSSHRAALLYKDYDYYSQFGWTEKPCLNYVWPTGEL